MVFVRPFESPEEEVYSGTDTSVGSKCTSFNFYSGRLHKFEPSLYILVMYLWNISGSLSHPIGQHGGILSPML